jgi:hypothetical protein
MEDPLEGIKQKWAQNDVFDGDIEWLIDEVEKLRAWNKSNLETITALTDAIVAKNQETK